MTKAVKKSVSIKDLPLPRGYTIVGGTGTKKDLREPVKKSGTARLPR
jgi:hypothetical protein